MKKLNLLLSLVLTCLFFISCSNEDTENISEQPTSKNIVEKIFRGSPILVEKLESGYYAWGDIILDESHFGEDVDISSKPNAGKKSKLGFSPGARKWTDNTINYVIAGGFSQSVLNEIQLAFNEWTASTNIRFRRRTNEANYITISSNGSDCNCGVALLGMNGSRGFVQLGLRATRSVITHEFGHTLGFIHEQNRSDRDQFVDILPQNIQSDALSQFNRVDNSVNPGAYDFSSIMSYSSYTFSTGGPVMLTKSGNTIPYNSVLSAGDISGTNQLYPGRNDDGGDDDGGDDDGDDDDDNGNSCSGVAEWTNRSYNVGERVTYQGYLFERDFSGWIQLGQCGVTTPVSKCSGVKEWDGSIQYNLGDKITYQGSLYEYIGNNTWTSLGSCN